MLFWIRIFPLFIIAGASVQNGSGDAETRSDVWSVQPQVEAQLFGQGETGLWPI